MLQITCRKILVALLLLITALPSAMVFGQVTPGDRKMDLPASQMASMNCCKGDISAAHEHTDTGHPEGDMACGDMTKANCAVAASLGNCGSALTALAPEKNGMALQLSSTMKLCHYGTSYLSIILDTLTPPPNTSKA